MYHYNVSVHYPGSLFESRRLIDQRNLEFMDWKKPRGLVHNHYYFNLAGFRVWHLEQYPFCCPILLSSSSSLSGSIAIIKKWKIGFILIILLIDIL